jgi:hypothetical protein
VAFSPEGALLATGSTVLEFDFEGRRLVVRGGEARLWRADGRPAGPALPHPRARLRDRGFSADGKWALIGSREGPARLWDLNASRPIGMPYAAGKANTLAIDPRGRCLALGGDNPTLFQAPAPLEGTPQQLRRWAERLTGLRLDEQGSIHLLK